MKYIKKLFSNFGIRKQSGVADSQQQNMEQPSALKFGRVIKVHPKDDTVNKVGAYLTYDVMLSPNGVIIQDIPSCMTGSQIIDRISPNAPALSTINSDEAPYVIGQSVLVGFVNSSHLNAVIIAACASQFAPSQTTAEYPQKTSTWQGASDKVDKNGTRTIAVLSGQKIILEQNGVPLLTVDGTSGTLKIGTGAHPGVIGDALVTFLSGHTHPVTTAPGTTGASLTPTTGIESSVYTVQ